MTMKKYIVLKHLFCGLVVLVFLIDAICAEPVLASGGWRDIGTLPGPPGYEYTRYASPNGVSADGSVVVGDSSNLAFRWTQATGMVDLGALPGLPYSMATGVSADGSVVVGISSDYTTQRTFRWTQATGMVDLGALPGLPYPVATGVSADGSVVVGFTSDDNGVNHATRWTRATGIVDLGPNTSAYGVSADGNIVFGNRYLAGGRTNNSPSNWSLATGWVNISIQDAYAKGASNDGSIIVGIAVDAIGKGYVFRWTQAGGFEKLQNTVSGTQTFYFSQVNGVSADGNVIVGKGNWAPIMDTLDRTVVWTQATGRQSVKQWLAANGGETPTFDFTWSNAVSADGNTVVGEYYFFTEAGEMTGGAYLAHVESSVTRLCSISGTVYDSTGKPLPGVSITIASQNVVTDQFGIFSIASIPSGTYTVTASKIGYSTQIQTITLTSGISLVRNFRLTSEVTSNIKVVDVSSKYNGFLYYLAGTDFSVTYVANITWGNHQPGIVRFITSNGTYDVPTTGTTAYKTFNIATDFEPCTTLRVVAIAADGKMSAEKSADFTVMSPIIGGLAFNAIDVGDGFYYKQKLELNLLGEGIGAGSIPSNIPLFGGKEFKLNIVPSVDIMVNSSGKTEIGLEVGLNGSTQNKTKTSVAGMELSLAPKVQLEGDYVHPGCYYQWSGSVGLAGSAIVSKSWPFVVMAGPIPVPMYAKASLQVDANAMLGVISLDPVALEGQPFSIKPYARGSLGAGVDETIAIEGWLGGGADFLLQYPQLPHMKDATIALNGGVTVYALLWKWENEALRWDWNLTGGAVKTIARAARSSFPTAYLVSRDYLTTTSTFGKQNSKTTLKSVALSTNQIYTVSTTPLQTSIFSYSEPRLSSAGTNTSLTWLTDNATRSAVNRTQTVFSTYSGSTWSTPQSIADDGTADFSPVALTFSDGTVIAAWEDEKIVLPDTATFNDMVQNLEISTSIYDPVAKTWKPYQRLTDNAYIDRSPKLAGKAKDNVMLVWISNDANDIRGGSAAPNKIWYATFNGTVWSTPQLAAQVPFGIVKYSLAYDGSHARLVMSLDTDGDSSTVADHELYLLSYDSNTWGALTRMTNDTVTPVADDNPQVAIDPDGDFVLTWLRGNEISSVVNFDMADRSVIWADSDYSSNLADFKLISAPDGKMAIVWAEPSANSSDIFTAVYDPIFDLWGGPKQLTFDAETEKNITAAFLGSETLVAVYNRTLMGQATPSATDLYMLTHTMGNDLALQGGSLVAMPPNPAPGDSVTFTVTALNLGDTAQESIPVAFYQGDPANGGIKISETTIAGPFKPGDTQNVSINWTIPLATSPLTIYAVIDPTATLDPVIRSNNVTTITLTMADLVLSNMSWTKLTDNLVSVTARVTNSGSISSQVTTIKFRQDSLSGTILNSQTLPALAMGEARDFNFIWDVTGLTNQQYMVFAVADEENIVIEFDETNNTGSVTIPVNLTNVFTTLSVQATGTGNGTVASAPDGLLCAGNCSGQFSWGTPVTITATSAPGSFFAGWGVPYTGNDSITLSMTGATTVTAQFISTTAPQIVILTLPDGAITSNSTLNITGTVTAVNGISSFSINNVAVPLNTNGTFSFPIQLSVGANIINSIATDNIGNKTTDNRTITLDQTTLQIIVISPADNSKTANITTIVRGTTDKTATVNVTVNGSSVQSAAINGNAFSANVNLTAGLNIILISATDVAGNTSSVKRTITYDNSKPTLAVTDPGQDISTNQKSITLKGMVSDTIGAVGITITLDGQIFTPTVSDGAFQLQLTFTTAKQYAIVVAATDDAGNTATVQRNVIYQPATGVTTLGDVNGDGRIDIIDALLTLQYAVNLIPHNATNDASYLAYADVSPLDLNQMPKGDRIIDISDALMILRRAVNFLNW